MPVGSPRTLAAAVGLGPGDHGSWAYDDLPGLRSALVEYFREGVARGEQLLYIGNGGRDALLDDLAGLPERDALLVRGQLDVHASEELYLGGSFSPHLQVEVFHRRAEAAVQAGFPGLRVLGDITTLVADEALTQHLIEYELAVDTMYAASPALALCAFDRRRVGARWRLVTVLHRLQHLAGHEPTFAVTVSPGVVHLVGEVDTSCAADLSRVLDAIDVSTQGELVIDLLDLEFIDIAATRVLALFQRRLIARGRAIHFAGVGPAAVNTLRAFALNGELLS